MSNFFLDTEFNDNGKTIDLISIALVHESREYYYAVSSEFDEAGCNDWVRDNVLPQIATTPKVLRQEITENILTFVMKHAAGKPAVIWGWYAAYDWVALCQLYGPMMNLPKVFPHCIRDLKCYAGSKNDTQLPKQGEKHNALRDAQWIHEVYRFLLQGAKI